MGVADFCTPEKTHLAGRHTREVIDPFYRRLRKNVAVVMYSLPGDEDLIRKQLDRSRTNRPTAQQRAAGQQQLAAKLSGFSYQGQRLSPSLILSQDQSVIDYFRQFPGLDAGPKFNNASFWKLPIPVTRDITVHPNDVVIYDAQGCNPLKKFLQKNGIRHALLTGYTTDICFCRTHVRLREPLSRLHRFPGR